VSPRQETEGEVLQHGTGDMYAGQGGTHDAVRERGRMGQTCGVHQERTGFQLHDGQRGGVPGAYTRKEFHNVHMHIQQSQYNQHRKVAGKGTGTACQVQHHIPTDMVRRATAEATCVATDHTAPRILSNDSRGKHRIHAEAFRE